MPCNACRGHKEFLDLGLPQDGPLVSSKDVVEVLRNHKRITPSAPRARTFSLKAGHYTKGNEVTIINGEISNTEQLKVIDIDGREMNLQVVGGGSKLKLIDEGDIWIVPNNEDPIECTMRKSERACLPQKSSKREVYDHVHC